MNKILDIMDNSEPRFEWPNFVSVSSPGTVSTISLSPEKTSSINNHISNLELIVKNLVNKTNNLEKKLSNSDKNNNWVYATENNIKNKNLLEAKSNTIKSSSTMCKRPSSI
jgi:hypothetical protein